MRGLLGTLAECLRSGAPASLATVIELATPAEPGAATVLGAKLLARPGEDPIGSVGSPLLDHVVARDALGALETGLGAVRHYGLLGELRLEEVTVYYEVFAPPRRMVIFGAVDFTAALVRLAGQLGYRTTVCDARAVFATRARFPDADEVVVDWPQRYVEKIGDSLGPRDALCVLTHDNKFDVPAILAAVATRVGYIGAMGSRRTHAGRLERLRAAGISEADLARVMAPIGIDIGARTPEETAVSICAEIISFRSGVPVPSLRDGDGPIHRQALLDPLATPASQPG